MAALTDLQPLRYSHLIIVMIMMSLRRIFIVVFEHHVPSCKPYNGKARNFGEERQARNYFFFVAKRYNLPILVPKC